jgi:GT2 family glycosyltransferase
VTVPSIAAVLVNWNSRDDVLAALASLRAQEDPALSIVVVDNGSVDGSAAAIREACPEVHVIEAGENLGFAEGCNRGIEAARGDWVFLFNNDATADPDCLAELRRALADATEEVGMVQPLIIFAARPMHANSTGILVRRSGEAYDRDFDRPVAEAGASGEPFCATAGAALYRRSMLEEVRLPSGYLDRGFFMYFEDVDLGWRCRLAGYRTRFVPGAVVRHRYQGSASRLGRSFVLTQSRVNRIATLLRTASPWFLLRTARHTLRDLFRVLRDAGPRPIVRLFRRLPGLFRDRARVTRLARVERSALEREWIKRLRRSSAHGSRPAPAGKAARG